MTFPNFSWRALMLPLVLVLLWWLPAGSASAAVNCTATMSNVAFGTVDLVDGAPAETTATLNYECTNDALLTTVLARVCFNIGDGAESGGNFNPRLMKDTAGTNALAFRLYQSTSGVIWGSTGNAAVPSPYAVNLSIPPFLLGLLGRTTGSTTLRGVLVSGQSSVPAGAYQDNFAGVHTSMSVTTSTGAPPTTCGNTTLSGKFGFLVSATVARSCVVTANPLNFGPVDGLPGRPNVDGESTIGITCSTNTPYTVALTPQNNNAVGAGVMKATTGGNTDSVPYRLYSNAARSTPWGNTLTVNRVAGTGTGVTQPLRVYGRVLGASVNVRPDDYLDVVTVNVSY